MSDLAAAVESALAPRQAKRRGEEIDFLCVAHDETNPSASWNRKKESWHCMKCGAGGSTRDLAQRLGIAVEERKPGRRPSEIAAEYSYTDEEGRLLYQCVRMVPKSFKQRRPDGAGGWVWNLEGVNRVLYRLPELLASTGAVYVVEGEKDADRLRERGLTATTNVGGAGKWRPQYSEVLRGRHVVVLPDNDDAGDKHGAVVAQSLQGFASSVKVLRLTGLDKKGDVSDWLNEGGTVAELEALAAAAPEWAPQGEPTTAAHYPETDAGNAELFAFLHGDRVRYDHGRARWLIWDRHRWAPDATGELVRLAIDTARTRMKAASDLYGEARDRAYKWAVGSESAAKIEAMLKLTRALPPIADRGEGWDSNPLLLGCENGVVNLATGELRPGRRDDRVTRSTKLDFDRNATCPRWEQFMEEVFPDAKVREYVRRAFGYSLTGVTREHVWFLCYGSGANGKSTFLDVARWVAGEYGHNMAFSTIEKDKQSSIPADMAALAGMRAVTVSETEEYSRVNEARLKGLTGEDPITARELYKPQFTFQPELKLWLAVNHKPRTQDNSDGFWRRVRMVPFTEAFPPERRDDDLRTKLKAELPGILAWAVRAATDWHRGGLGPVPPAIAVATVEYREESDPLAPFISECCAVTDEAATGAADLYKAYKEWGESEGMGPRDLMTATTFGRRVAERFTRGTIGGRRQYRGIGLLSAGWTPQPSPKVIVAESSEGLREQSSSVPLARAREFSGNASQPSPPSPCECEALHGDPEACADEIWWQDEAGVWHCGVHHPEEASAA